MLTLIATIELLKYQKYNKKESISLLNAISNNSFSKENIEANLHENDELFLRIIYVDSNSDKQNIDIPFKLLKKFTNKI